MAFRAFLSVNSVILPWHSIGSPKDTAGTCWHLSVFLNSQVAIVKLWLCVSWCAPGQVPARICQSNVWWVFTACSGADRIAEGLFFLKIKLPVFEKKRYYCFQQHTSPGAWVHINTFPCRRGCSAVILSWSPLAKLAIGSSLSRKHLHSMNSSATSTFVCIPAMQSFHLA